MRPTLILVAALALLAGGCTAVHTAKNSSSDEYVDYYPTGSKIPVKVKKSDLQTSSTETAASQEMIRDMQTKTSILPTHGN